jgi:hypothetical protein
VLERSRSFLLEEAEEEKKDLKPVEMMGVDGLAS